MARSRSQFIFRQDGIIGIFPFLCWPISVPPPLLHAAPIVSPNLQIFRDLGPRNIHYCLFLFCFSLSVEINNLRVLAFAEGLLVSEKINKSVHLSLSSFPTPCRHIRTKDVLSITLACYTPLVTNPEVTEFGFSVKMRVAMTTSWCLALHGRVFWTGLYKACLLDRDPLRDLVPFAPSKHHTNINQCPSGRKSKVSLCNLGNKNWISWKWAWIWTSLWAPHIHG